MGGISVNGDGGERVEPSYEVVPALAGEVADFALTSGPEGVLERVVSLVCQFSGWCWFGPVCKGIVERTAQPVAHTVVKMVDFSYTTIVNLS